MHTTRRRDPRAAKRRDIARSVLPSTARRGARRNLTGLRRTHRRAVAATLTTLRGARESCDVTLPDYPISRHHEAIWERRNHDKLGPLLRWAAHEAEGLEVEAARLHLSGALPAGLVGAHAMSHVEWSVLRDRRPRSTRVERPGSGIEVVVRSIGAWALEAGRHGELNHQIHQRLPTPLDPSGETAGRQPRRRLQREGSSSGGGRPLLGAHDLDSWTVSVVDTAHQLGGVRVQSRYRRWRDLGPFAPVAAWANGLGWRADEPVP